jgi:long-chain acyl-CoA synthetase
VNLARLGEESVQTWGEYVSLAFEDREWTNVEQQRAASRFAHALRRLGVQVGDRVLVLLPNCPEVLQAYAGILKAGGVIVPVVFLLSADEVRHIVTDSEAKVVVTAPAFLDKVEGFTGPVVLIGGGAGGRPWDELLVGESEVFPSVDRARTTTSPSSSTPPAPPAGPRAWRCRTAISRRTHARRPASTNWTGRPGR